MRKIMNERLPISTSLPLKARFYDYKHFTYPWHFHAEYEIIYIKESAGTRFVGNSMEKYSAGDVLLLGSNLPHYMKSDDAYYQEDTTLRVRGTIVQFEKEFMYYSIRHYPHLAGIRQLLEDAREGIVFPAGTSDRLAGMLDSLPEKRGIEQFIAFLEVLKEMSEVRPRRIISSGGRADAAPDDTSRIDKIISYLNAHYTRGLSLDEVASFAAMNPSAFCRFFRKKTGKSLTQYLAEMRVAYACKLLLMDQRNISQVSTECGFETISHFNKAFRKNTGLTPSEYRKIMLQG